MKKLIGVAFAILCMFLLVDYGLLERNYICTLMSVVKAHLCENDTLKKMWMDFKELIIV